MENISINSRLKEEIQQPALTLPLWPGACGGWWPSRFFCTLLLGRETCSPGLELLLAQKSSLRQVHCGWLCCMTALVNSHQEALGCLRMELWGQSGYNSCPASSLW